MFTLYSTKVIISKLSFTCCIPEIIVVFFLVIMINPFKYALKFHLQGFWVFGECNFYMCVHNTHFSEILFVVLCNACVQFHTIFKRFFLLLYKLNSSFSVPMHIHSIWIWMNSVQYNKGETRHSSYISLLQVPSLPNPCSGFSV